MAVGFACWRLVDLTPHVSENFFFAKNDPQLESDRAIGRIFPQKPVMIVMASGDLDATAYEHRLADLSAALAREPDVASVRSLADGPKNLEDARKSPLWSPLLIASDGRSSNVFVSFTRPPDAAAVERIDALRRRFDAPDFEVAVSGVPYITDRLGHGLARDLRVLTPAAAVLFGAVFLVVFRSTWILAGMLCASADSSAATLLATHALHIAIGPLTANLATIVFVMTLSPIVFLTYNWRRLRGDATIGAREARRAAVRETAPPSFWSATCMVLGFVSLLLVPSTPMRHLGLAGGVGAALAVTAAYAVYPWFLEHAAPPRARTAWAGRAVAAARGFFSRRHGALVAALAVFTVVGAVGLRRLNTDPALPTYFTPGGRLRTGLEAVDRAGGSTPLEIVVADAAGGALDTGDEVKRLAGLQDALAHDPAVGTVLALPEFIGEARRHFLSFLFSDAHLVDALDSPTHGAVGRTLIDPSRTKALFQLRMKEMSRRQPRQQVLDRIAGLVRRAGFREVLVGGTYSLLNQQARLVSTSILTGVLLLVALFVAMGYALSRSAAVAGAMLASLAIIPVVVRGYIAWMGMPLDFLTASAANLDLGMGVDAMIYLTMAARQAGVDARDPWTTWSSVSSRLWQPIGTSMLVVGSGFGVFLLSAFPPTRHFGLFVMFGSATAATAALVLFPWLATIRPARAHRHAAAAHAHPHHRARAHGR